MTNTTRIAQLADGRWASYATNAEGDEYATGIFDTEHEAKASARADQLRDEHNAIWTPILAAHRVAAALRTIAEALPHLSESARAEVLRAIHPAWGHADGIKLVASCVGQTAPLPIEPTDDDRQAQWERFYDAQCDAHPRDTAHAWLDQMTEAEKVEEIAQAALDDMLD